MSGSWESPEKKQKKSWNNLACATGQMNDNMKVVLLSQLTDELLQFCNAWVALDDSHKDDEMKLTPALITDNGLISMDNGEVWCLCEATFNNNMQQIAVCMCRSETRGKPVLWSVFHDGRSYPVMVPPAPDFVLTSDGPAVLSKKFDLTIEDVFPITIEVIPEFETRPHRRKVKIFANGELMYFW